MLRLEGYDTTWNSYKQARQGSYTLPAGHEPAGDKTYRIIVSTKYLQYNGMMARIKFRAHDSQPLTIRSAYIVQQNTDAGADPYDGSTQMQYKAITFDGGGTAATIPANEAKWSDWIQMEDVGPVPAPLPLDKASSYLITFYVPNADEIVYWENANIGDDPMSYVRSGETAAGEVNWPVGINGEQRIYAVEEMFVSYVKEGAYSSQIFDTAVEDPVFTKMQYTAITNSDSSLNLKVRSGDNKASLEADSDWADITGISLVGNPGDISAVSGGRYVQFKAGFSAVSGGVTAESYDNSCVLKDVSIYWPGNTTMVDIGGYFTKQPDYGIFTIEVDGQKLTKGFEIKLSVGDDTVTGAAVNRSVTAEVEPRNTGK
jgi:hypothetical protein